ncbi:type IIL restriction-modification enzyme MmeI [Roseicella aerolata]|uniref:site-specific DNA-methyltransferase (adenine-specific) n=1 Tax=Roseicella aerolata TaxID=2883479 RepID=A0A9X1LDG1_9PROT|nr:type IIL restriction-modification enzyme MmeI [Roseicella aerolata]MCB4824752.1 hypothetical protein [Roseicella aerolata]
MEDWPAQIAQVALWLTDHQMNMELSEEFGTLRMRLPLTTAPNILPGNALREDWAGFVKPGPDVYCVGNPPFIGHQYRSAEQQADMHRVWGREGKVNRLDYVTCWYRKAVDWMVADPRAESCFVSTNSITQGEQVGTLWGELLPRGLRIRFAHRTFQWTSEARGRAAVHCVIIGFLLREPARRVLYDYIDIRGEPQAVAAENINPYLLDAPDVLLPSRTRPPPGMPRILQGSKPVDGGHLILTDEERTALIAAEPAATAWIRPFLGSSELINGTKRFCLWLRGIPPQALRGMPLVAERVRKVREVRLKSPTLEFRKSAEVPTLFTQDRQPAGEYIAVPEVSSENRRFIPMAFLQAETVASNLLLTIEGGTYYHFGVLTSTMHMDWMRAVAGRLESRYRYAPSVYNTFPWPDPTPAQRAAIEATAQAILDARANHPGATLADLYDPIAMPPDLAAAHAANDRAVDAAYGQPRGWPTEAARLAFLFARYQGQAAPLDAAPPRRPAARRRRAA